MDIPYPLFQAWNGFLSNTPRTTSVDQSPSTSGGTSQELLVQNTYTDLLECSIPGNSFGFSEDPVIRTEIHKNPQRLAGTVMATNIRRKWVTDKAKKKNKEKILYGVPQGLSWDHYYSYYTLMTFVALLVNSIFIHSPMIQICCIQTKT